MVDITLVRKRGYVAIDHYINYIQSMFFKNGKLFIKKKETYVIDWDAVTCTCQDFKRHGRLTPCKHLFMALIHKNSLNQEGEDIEKYG